MHITFDTAVTQRTTLNERLQSLTQ